MNMDELAASTAKPLEELQDYAKVIRQKEYFESSRASVISYEKGLDRTLASLRVSLNQEIERSQQVCLRLLNRSS